MNSVEWKWQHKYDCMQAHQVYAVHFPCLFWDSFALLFVFSSILTVFLSSPLCLGLLRLDPHPTPFQSNFNRHDIWHFSLIPLSFALFRCTSYSSRVKQYKVYYNLFRSLSFGTGTFISDLVHRFRRAQLGGQMISNPIIRCRRRLRCWMGLVLFLFCVCVCVIWRFGSFIWFVFRTNDANSTLCVYCEIEIFAHQSHNIVVV